MRDSWMHRVQHELDVSPRCENKLPSTFGFSRRTYFEDGEGEGPVWHREHELRPRPTHEDPRGQVGQLLGALRLQQRLDHVGRVHRRLRTAAGGEEGGGSAEEDVKMAGWWAGAQAGSVIDTWNQVREQDATS